jgi:hypothetical protein
MNAVRLVIPKVGLLTLKVFVALLPALIVVGILHFRYGTNIYEHVPIWNDEVGYWHQAATFAAVGFEGGYYALNENPAQAAWTRFDVHGPWYPMLYGTLGRLLGGWELYTGVLVNLILFSTSILIFILTVRPSGLQLLTLGLVLASMHPVLLYLPTSMSEGMQAAIAMLLAAIFWRLLRQRGQVKPWQMIGYGAFLWLVTVTRLSWGILLLPFFLLAFPFTVRGVLLALLMTVATAILAYSMVAWTTPGSSNHSVMRVLAGFSSSMQDGVNLLGSTLNHNLELYLSSDKSPLDRLLTLQIGGLLLLVALSGAVAFLLKSRSINKLVLTSALLSHQQALFHLYNMLGIVVASLMLYVIAVDSDYRVIGHHVLLSLALMLACRHFVTPAAFAASFLLSLATFFGSLDAFVIASGRYTARAGLEQITLVRQAIAYDPGAESPWCNTVLMEVESYQNFVTLLPPGLGITWVWKLEELESIRSRYVWLRGDRQFNAERLSRRGLSLSFIDHVPDGQLYLNEASACPR